MFTTAVANTTKTSTRQEFSFGQRDDGLLYRSGRLEMIILLLLAAWYDNYTQVV